MCDVISSSGLRVAAPELAPADGTGPGETAPGESHRGQPKLVLVSYCGYQPGYKHFAGRHFYNVLQTVSKKLFAGTTVSEQAIREEGFELLVCGMGPDDPKAA